VVCSETEHLQVVGGDDLRQLGLQQRRKVLRALRRRAPIALLRRTVPLLRRTVSLLRRTPVLLGLAILLRLAVGLLRRVAALLRRRSIPLLRGAILLLRRGTVPLLRRCASSRSPAACLLDLGRQAPSMLRMITW
jgi:hypothetical protein